MKRIIFILTMLLTLAVGASAQPPMGGGRPGGRPTGEFKSQGILMGSIVLTPENAGEEETPGVGVTVVVIAEGKSKLDTLYTVGDKSGNFVFPKPFLAGHPINVRFTMVGYEDLAKTIVVKAGMNRVVANLKPVKYNLDGAVVKETVTPLKISGDTLIFNPNAVKVNKGDMAIDILEQMPGVEVTDSGVKILNEDLTNVYIDGALLFGEAPMKALNQLPAEEVVSMKSYQEYANKDPHHKIRKTETRERVLDIETKTHPKMVWHGDYLSGIGFDTDSVYHKLRYTVGGDTRMSSEGLQAGLTFNVNNINDASTRRRGNSFRGAPTSGGAADLRNLTLSADVNRRWMSKETKNYELGSLRASYNYDNKYTVTESISQILYFANDKYDYREANSTSYYDNTSKYHDFSLSGAKSLRDGRISVSAGASISDGLTNTLSSDYNHQDNLAPQGTTSSTISDTHANGYSGSVIFMKGFADKFKLTANASASIGNTDGTQAKVDSTTSTITNKVLDITSGQDSRNFSFSTRAGYEFSDYSSLSFNYNFRNVHSVVDRLALDVTDPNCALTDSVNTQKLTNDNIANTVGLSFTHYFEKIKANMNVSAGYCWRTLGRDETFPYDDTYGETFASFQPSISLGTDSMLNKWNVSYDMSSSAPSLEQVRPRLDNSNLYSVSAGNRNLKQSTTHAFSFRYSTVLGRQARSVARDMDDGDYRSAAEYGLSTGMGGHGMGHGMMGRGRRNSTLDNYNTFTVEGDARLNTDVIATKRTYFAQETYLPEYQYTMPAQSTFTTYENVDNSYSASLSVRDDASLKFLKSTLSTRFTLSWDDSPAFVDGTLTRTDNFRPSLGMHFMTGFSRNFRVNMSGTAAYIHSKNSEKDVNDYFTERLNIGLEGNNIFQHGYAGANYSKVFTQGLSYSKINDNILNVNAGMRFGPRNNFDLAVSVNDVFNKNTGFSTSMNADYIRNNWNHNFGRYVLFTFAYRFSSLKGAGGPGHGPGAGPSGHGGGMPYRR